MIEWRAEAHITTERTGIHHGGRVTVKVHPDANHLFMKALTGNPSEYPTLEKLFVPGLVDDVAGWVTAVTSREP